MFNARSHHYIYTFTFTLFSSNAFVSFILNFKIVCACCKSGCTMYSSGFGIFNKVKVRFLLKAKL